MDWHDIVILYGLGLDDKLLRAREPLSDEDQEALLAVAATSTWEDDWAPSPVLGLMAILRALF